MANTNFHTDGPILGLSQIPINRTYACRLGTAEVDTAPVGTAWDASPAPGTSWESTGVLMQDTVTSTVPF